MREKERGKRLEGRKGDFRERECWEGYTDGDEREENDNRR